MLLKRIYNKLRFNRLNLLKTIYINFRFFDFKQALKFPILIYGPTVFNFHKGCCIKICNQIKRGMIKIGISDPFRSYKSYSLIELKGELEIEENIIIRRGIRIFLDTNAKLKLRNNVFISDNTNIYCMQYIKIGTNTIIGNNCSFMDSDLHFILDRKTRVIKNSNKPVIIGSNNWISGWSVVKKGAETPEGTILAGPYSMIGKDYINKIPPYSIIGGNPAKLIKEEKRIISNKKQQSELYHYYKINTVDYMVDPSIDEDKFCI